jgi:hypothetical protein
MSVAHDMRSAMDSARWPAAHAKPLLMDDDSTRARIASSRRRHEA